MDLDPIRYVVLNLLIILNCALMFKFAHFYFAGEFADWMLAHFLQSYKLRKVIADAALLR